MKKLNESDLIKMLEDYVSKHPIDDKYYYAIDITGEITKHSASNTKIGLPKIPFIGSDKDE